jgi:hypothetical protein
MSRKMQKMQKMNDQQLEQVLEAALKRRADAPHDDAAVKRVMMRFAGPLPRQKMPFWRLPAVLLDWQFAPAWPRVAALAGCAVLGFAIGIAGLDRRFDTPPASFTMTNITGVGSMVFEPEPLTGARP